MNGRVRAAWAVAAAILAYAILALPHHPAAMTWAYWRVFPLEWPVVMAGALLVAGRRGARAFAGLAAVLLTALLLFKAVDFAMFTAVSRAFNFIGDWTLIASAWHLGTGALGLLRAGGLMIGTALFLAAVCTILYKGFRAFPVLRGRPAYPIGALTVGALFLAVSVYEAGGIMGRWALAWNPPGAAFSLRMTAERAVATGQTRADLVAFNAAARADPVPDRPGLFDRIERDVLVVFVESYARVSHDGPLYAPTHRATLQAAEAALADSGMAMRSAFLQAPTRGGQSWLSHISFATGLWVPDQSRYTAALTSGRQGLFHLAQRAGFETAAVMPAITMAWPEARAMGFETIIDAADMGYAGPAFNWVTMPDQFTLSVVDRQVLRPGPRRPVFAQVALISSHAPWVPVPDMVPWAAVGDGSIFAPMVAGAPTPEEVWRDRDRVRLQYRAAIDYSLRALFSYVERVAGPNAPLIFVIGDHPPAPFVAQDTRADVPIHVIGPAHLVDRIAEWGWDAGLLPDAAREAIRMDAMRDKIVDAFSAPLPPQRADAGPLR